MRQRPWSWGHKLTIKDASGADVFHVGQRAFAFGTKLSFTDTAGRELVLITRKFLSWGTAFNITRGKVCAAVVRRNWFTIFGSAFTVVVSGSEDITARGSFLGYDYSFTRQGKPIAQLSRRRLSWTETYEIDVAEGQDDVLILAAAVVIDLVCHRSGGME